MDWELAIRLNRTALLRLLAGLFAGIGMVPGGQAVETVTRRAHLAVLYVLRPAEAAARRLIVIRALLDARQRGVVRRNASRKGSAGGGSRGGGQRGPLFRLFDPRKKVGPGARRRYGKGPEPRIFFMDARDRFAVPAPVPSPDDGIDATGLTRRMTALHRALEDIPGQAQRLARVQARRRKAGMSRARTEPVRRGRPPGHRRNGRHEVDGLLRECHQLALMAAAGPDTS